MEGSPLIPRDARVAAFRRWLWLHPHVAVRRASRWVFLVGTPPWRLRWHHFVINPRPRLSMERRRALAARFKELADG